jgi:hypothetical protein
MSDGMAAPAGGAPAPGGDSAPSNTNTETTAAPKAPAAPSWSDKDDAELVERFKRSPYRLKHKGAEQAIDSPEALKAFINDAQRGKGASKVVEEAKREAAEAKREREEASRERELIKRARAGDWNARKELGLVDPREIKARQDEWEAVPPEVRELYEERNREAKRADELEAKWKAKEAEEHQRREEAEISTAKRLATNETHRVMKSLGITEANAERLMPFVAGAIADLSELGLELGVDMTQELIVERFKQLKGGFDEEMFSSLEPSRAIAAFSKQLDSMDDATLSKALPPKLAQRIAKMVARSVTQRRAQPQQGATAQPANTNRQEETEQAPKVLSFGRRW